MGSSVGPDDFRLSAGAGQPECRAVLAGVRVKATYYGRAGEVAVEGGGVVAAQA